MLIVTSPKYY